MIFELLDGRNLLYQWDLNRKITVNDESIKEVHFCNRTGECSLVVEVVDGLANIPNILLQSSFDIRVYGYDGEATLHEEVFKVKARTRPADYVYSEEHEYTIEYYLKRAIDEAKANGEFNGDKGDKGDQGEKGDTGEKGDKGDPFTYEDFTEEQLEALRGPEGPQGPQGEKGDKGERGESGADVEFVTIKNNDADIQAILDAGKWPVLKCHVATTNRLYFLPLISKTPTEILFAKAEVNSSLSGGDVAYKRYLINTAAWENPNGMNFIKIPKLEVNPTTTTDTLTSIQINGVSYAIPGADVDLTGYATEEYVDNAIAEIEITGGGGSKLYNHHISISTVCTDSNNRNKNDSINILVTNSNSEAYTRDSFAAYLTNNGYTSTDKYYPATGGIVINRYDMNSIQATETTPSEFIGVYYTGSLFCGVYNNPSMTGNLSTTVFNEESGASEYKFNFRASVIEVGVAAGGSGEPTDLTNYYTKEEVDSQIETTTKFETVSVRTNRTDGHYYITEEDANKVYNNPLRYKLNHQNTEYTYDRRYITNEGTVSITNLLFIAHSFETGSNNAPISDSKNINIKTINISTNNKDSDGNYIITEVTSIDLASKDYVDEAVANAGGSGGGSAEGAVSYLEAQDLTTEQKNQAKANLDLPYTEITPITYFTNQSGNAVASQRYVYIYTSNQPSIKQLASAAIGTTFSITVKNASSNPTLTETIDCEKTTLSAYKVLTDATDLVYLSDEGSTVDSSGLYVCKKTNTDSSGYGSTVYVDLIVNVPSGVNKLSEELIESTLLSGIEFDNSKDYQMTFITKSLSSSYSAPAGNVVIGNKNNILGGSNSYYFGYENKGVQNNYPNFIIGNNNRAGYYEYSEYASGSAPAKNMFMLGSYLKPSQNTNYASIVVGCFNEKTSKYIPYDSATTYNTGDCVTTRQTNYSSAVYRCLQDGVKGKSIPSSATSNDYWEYVDDGKSSEYVFTVGNGSSTARSNAFTIDALGNVVSAGTMTATGADYAEYFEFEDGNTNNEDRMGLLVELVNGKIKLANGTDILGATSASKGVIGDAEEMNWHGKYERDELGRLVFEEVEVEREVTNEETGETEIVKELITIKKISKDYDPNRPYQPRSSRKEWYPVGLLGKVLVRQDGSLSAGDYVKAINGIATKSEEKTNIRVLEIASEGIVRVLVK